MKFKIFTAAIFLFLCATLMQSQIKHVAAITDYDLPLTSPITSPISSPEYSPTPSESPITSPISAPYVNLLFPIGVETFNVGDIINIAWNPSSEFDQYDIFYTFPSNFLNPIGAVFSGIHFINWTVPADLAGQIASIFIGAADYNYAKVAHDQSGYFSINPTPSPEPSVEPTASPEPSSTPGPTVNPQSEGTPQPEVTPTPEPTVAPTSAPSTPSNTSSPSNSGGSNGGNASGFGCGDAKPGSAPILWSAIVTGKNQVKLVWSPAKEPSATHYVLTYGIKPGSQQYGNPNIGNVTSYTVNGLSAGVTYYFKVRAQRGCMPGDFSNELASGKVFGQTINKPAKGFTVGILGKKTSTEIKYIKLAPPIDLNTTGKGFFYNAQKLFINSL